MEIALAKALWMRGLRYRKNDKSVFGTPDLTFKKSKVAVFVDGEFFHGKDWEVAKFAIKSRRDFWWPKIEGNIKRDRSVDLRLRKDGWMVVRFWASCIKLDLASCVSKVEAAIKH